MAGCDGGDPAAPPSGGAGPFSTPEQLQVATCQDWKDAGQRERLFAIDALEEIVAGPAKRGRTLPDEAAYDVLDRRCGNDFARGFLLYELYTRAAAFAPHGDD